MKNKYHRWLSAEINQWVLEGLMDEARAVALRKRYPVSGSGWGQSILSVIGAAVAGLGVILFFAYNWAELHKYLKLALVFAGLMLSHGGALWTAQRHPTHRG